MQIRQYFCPMNQFTRPNPLSILMFIMLFPLTVFSQEKTDYEVACIAFYNLENLFDTVRDTSIRDTEFLPEGEKNWTKEKFDEKIANMAYVISQIGTDLTKFGPTILGVSEIENRYVLEQLVAHPLIADRDYQIVHVNSPDARGIDVGLLYQANQFELTSTSNHYLDISESSPLDEAAKNDTESEPEEKKTTRDVLLVSGLLGGEETHFLVNHWPSRRGGEKRSKPKRIKAAKLCKSLVDSIQIAQPNSKVFIMGDFNDDPVSESIKTHLNAKKTLAEVKENGLFNPMADMYRRDVGSNAYRDAWSLFDQIIISESTLDKEQDGYFYYKSNVFNKKFLCNQSGQYKGYPFRTFVGDNYIGGYSDHFPVYVHLLKRKQ